MGISAEINLIKPANGAYTPGSVVSGVIKWTVDKESIFNKITISLKGYGIVVVKDKCKKRDQMPSYRNSEEYVDIDNVVLENDKGSTYPPNTYETNFAFNLPNDIPPSFKYSMSKIFECQYKPYRQEQNVHTTDIRSKIFYYIRIKFNRPGLMKFSKHFKKEITVTSGITPSLPTEPIIYCEQKSLFQLFQMFSTKKNIVNIKARIENSVVSTGGMISLNYEVTNESSVDIRGVETKLLEVHLFKSNGHTDVKISNEVRGTDTTSDVIVCGQTKSNFITIIVPPGCSSIENSKTVSRKYIVVLTVQLPIPHRDAVLEIPVQIGDVISARGETCTEAPPPSYWEVMGEANYDVENSEDV